MAVDPFALHAEIAEFGGPVTITIDPRCVVVTPWHAIVNRIRESLRGAGRHGSTGRGIREAKLGDHRLTVGDLTLEWPARASQQGDGRSRRTSRRITS